MITLALFIALCALVITWALAYDAGHNAASREILDQLERGRQE